MANFCESCGSAVSSGDAFCQKCGAKIERDRLPTGAPAKVAPYAQLVLAGFALLSLLGGIAYLLGGARSGPEKVVARYFEAVSKENYDEAASLLDPQATQMIELLGPQKRNDAMRRSVSSKCGPDGYFQSIETSSAKIDEDHVMVTSTIHCTNGASFGDSTKVNKVGGEWRIGP